MEQILSKANAYNWINRLQDTLQKHKEAAIIGEIAQDTDGTDDVYFSKVIMPIMNNKFQEEIYHATNFNIWNPQARNYQTLELSFLCAYIINNDKVNMGLSLLECAQYCQSINRIMVKMSDNGDEMIKEREYRESVNSIDTMLFELRGNLILENPERKNEINNAYMGLFVESEEAAYSEESKQPNNGNQENEELLFYFKNDSVIMQRFLDNIKGATPEMIIRKVNYCYCQGLLKVEKNAKGKESVKGFCECLQGLGYYSRTYKTFCESFAQPTKVSELV